MSRLLLFGGTTEARRLLERGVPAVCCVATEYGASLLAGLEGVDVRVGRLDARAMENLILTEKISLVADATHPYAVEVSKNIKEACSRTGAQLLRIARAPTDIGGATVANSCAEAAELLNSRGGRVLLTVGSKELARFTAVRDYQKRIFARVLPQSGVLRACEELGFDAGHIIAMQGPFSLALDDAMLESTGASVLVTKDGGDAGGMRAKVEAARSRGVEVIVIARPAGEGIPMEEALLRIRRHLGLARPPFFPLLIDLEGRKALILGGGAVASRRAGTLVACGARVLAVSPAFCADFPAEARREKRTFQPADLEGCSVAVAASDDREANCAFGQAARESGVPVSVADAPAESSFFFPALVSCGEAAASASTAGISPGMTRRLADRLRAVWPQWVAEECQNHETQRK